MSPPKGSSTLRNDAPPAEVSTPLTTMDSLEDKISRLTEALNTMASGMDKRVNDLENLFREQIATPEPPTIEETRYATPTSQSTTSAMLPRAATPTTYSGNNSNDFRTFLAQIRTVHAIEAPRYPTDRIKSMHMISFLTGAASAWALPYLEESFYKPSCSLDNFPSFVEQFTKTFDDPLRAQHANRKLSSLKQTGSAASYAAEFRKIAADSTVDDPSQQVFFFNGLKKALQIELVRARFQARNIVEYMDHTVDLAENLNLVHSLHNIDTNNNEHARPQQHSKGSWHNKASQPQFGPLTSVEKDQRKKANACAYCGWKGGRHKDSCKIGQRTKSEPAPASLNYVVSTTDQHPKVPTQFPAEH